MKKVLAVFAASLFVAGSALADTGWWSDFIRVSVDGVGDAFYWIGDDPTFGDQFAGSNIGTVNVGGAINLGADMRYWSDTQDREGGAFYYSVNGAPETEVIWNQIDLGGNDRQGLVDPADGPNIAAGAPVGTHEIAVWAKHWGSNQDDNWLNNGGDNYVGSFTVVPEPSSLLLGSMGLLGLLAARRRR
jgi:hypothetical protein